MLARYIELLNAIEDDGVEPLASCFSENVRFRDPFNDLGGKTTVVAVFAEIPQQLQHIRFDVTERAYTQRHAKHSTALIKWQLSANLKRLAGRPWQVEGCSEIQFNANGLVTAHLDYWDAAHGLYTQIPLIGSLMRALKRRIGN